MDYLVDQCGPLLLILHVSFQDLSAESKDECRLSQGRRLGLELRNASQQGLNLGLGHVVAKEVQRIRGGFLFVARLEIES